MTKSAFLVRLESILEADEGTVQGSSVLQDLEGWDSLAVMSTLAMFDKQFGVKVPAETIYKCRTVDELTALAGDQVID
jgi:acyl carrier protein